MADDRIDERPHAGVVMTGNNRLEPATGPWFALRHSPAQFAIFGAFPDIASRDAHVAGRGGDIFRDVERMNAILRRPAHVQKVDILFDKRVFA